MSFEPSWESLAQYQTPDWFRDAKFGIWAHWGPQCQPGRGDWYAHGMYQEGSKQYAEHVARYDHPSKAGFKEVIHDWKAEQWDPERLVELYKRAGAEYFVAMANHHDNLDLWDSTHQPWNSVNVGPRKNLIKGWSEAARKHDLRFGVSVHASHAWSWYEPAQGADREGPLTGVPYDGKLTKADGKGTWWEAPDPQELYAQDHEPMPDFLEHWSVINYWDWGNGFKAPDPAYCEKFYRRTIELIDRYRPDLLYFDDTVLPLYPISDAGLRIAAHFYNGNPDAVLNGKVLNPEQRKTMVWDIERGQSDAIEPLPWQTDTCIGDWHYNIERYEKADYKSAKTVIHTLADVVSKNGNLLLSVPLRGDGTPDDLEIAIVEGIAEWMGVHREAIVGTRPWKVSGEGPATSSAKPMSAQGFNEGTGKPFTAEDVRFTQKGETLYAISLGKPDGGLNIASLGRTAGYLDSPISSITLIGSNEKVDWRLGHAALSLNVPAATNEIANVFKIQFV